MEKIALFDTSIDSDNLGDLIIMDAVIKHLREMFPQDSFINIPTHNFLNKKNRDEIRECKRGFVGGTNLLCANWMLFPQWKINLLDTFLIPSPILMGVGWQYYQRSTDFLTAIFLRQLLSKNYIHSVRDSYTEQRLKSIGINNVINTACPTMWELTPKHCEKIPAGKAKNAITTITFYRKDFEADKKWMKTIIDNYEKIYFWGQMDGDEQYLKSMDLGKDIEILEPSLMAYDNALSNIDADFIGTRLHGGIRAIQHKKRALVIEIDNRAAEIAKDTGLPTVKRDDINGITGWIYGNAPLKIVLPEENITSWKAQFKDT